MPDEQAKPKLVSGPKLVRKLTIDLLENGSWTLNLQPSTPAMLRIESMGILTMVLGSLKAPPMVTPQTVPKGSKDVDQE